MFWTAIARFLQYFRNLSNSFINIFTILQDLNGIFSKYSFNITVLWGYPFRIMFIVIIVRFFIICFINGWKYEKVAKNWDRVTNRCVYLIVQKEKRCWCACPASRQGTRYLLRARSRFSDYKFQIEMIFSKTRARARGRPVRVGHPRSSGCINHRAHPGLALRL